MNEKVEVTLEITGTLTKRPVTEADLPWPQLLKIAQDYSRMLDSATKRLVKARAQKKALCDERDRLLVAVARLKRLLNESDK